MASSSSKHYNYFKEKRILQEEEKALKSMLNKFQDQLNRLKIEELALMSLMKMQATKKETEPSGSKPMKHEGENEHTGSLDSISDIASNSSSVLMVEDVAKMNKEIVDLNVTSRAGQDFKYVDNFEEEEEEEEDEENEEMDSMEAGEDYTRQLRTYMDSI